MSVVNGNVTPGYVFAYDSQLRILVTKDRLNLLGAPAVTVDLSGQVNSSGDDVAAGTISAAMLADAVADAILTITATVPDEATNNIDVSIQAKDIQGNALAARVSVWLWLAASSGGAPAALPSGGAPTVLNGNGVILYPVAATYPGQYMTSAAGLLELRFTEAGALTKYLNLLCQDRFFAGSKAMVWAA